MRKAGWHGRVGCIRVIMAQVVAFIKALARNNYKALAVLDIMQCLIGFSKRGCYHDTCDVEVVVVQIFVSRCSRSARSPPPRVLSSITFSSSIGFWSNVVLEAITSQNTLKAREQTIFQQDLEGTQRENDLALSADVRSLGQRNRSGCSLSTSFKSRPSLYFPGQLWSTCTASR